MKAFAAAFDLVPGWAYALMVLALSALLVSARLSAGAALVESAQAGRALSELVATSATASASSVQGARAKEGAMASDQAKDIHAFNQAVSNPAGRAAELERGMRDQAREQARSSRVCLPKAASTASGVDGSGGAGLPSMVEPDYLVVDGPAQSEIARLIVSARDTGEALKTCRLALVRCSASAQ